MMTQVLAEVSLNLAHFDRMHMREEWDSLREHDVVFLVSIQSPNVSSIQSRHSTISVIWMGVLVHIFGA